MNIQEMIKQRAEAVAAASDPAAKLDAKQVVASSAATTEGQQLVNSADAAAAGAQSKTRIADTAQDIRQPNSELPAASTQQVLAATAPVLTPELVAQIEAAVPKLKTFKHVYAGATVYKENGDMIRFGGGVGGAGYYATDKEDEIKYLTGIAEQHGSQVSVVNGASHEDEFRADLTEGANAARENSMRFQNPQALKAFENLGNQIANAS